MYLNGKEITGMYLGNQEISNAYVGDKEIFASEEPVVTPLYACYSLIGTYHYAKYPLGSDMHDYIHKSESTTTQVTKASDLIVNKYGSYSSITEESAVMAGYSFTRYPSGDLYS